MERYECYIIMSCHVMQLTDLLVAMVKLLIAKGAKVNKVAKGHSPLSLAIVHGHSKVCDVWSLLGAGSE